MLLFNEGCGFVGERYKGERVVWDGQVVYSTQPQAAICKWPEAICVNYPSWSKVPQLISGQGKRD